MCHSSGSWSEIQSPTPEPNLWPTCWEGGKEIRDTHRELGKATCWQSSAQTLAQIPTPIREFFCTWKFFFCSRTPTPPSSELQGSAAWEVSRWKSKGGCAQDRLIASDSPIPWRAEGRAERGWGEGNYLPEVTLQSSNRARNRSRLPALPWCHTGLFLTTPDALHSTLNPIHGLSYPLLL